LCPVERHQMMCELIPNSVLQVVKGAGHLPVLEQADVVSGLMVDWLTQCDR